MTPAPTTRATLLTPSGTGAIGVIRISGPEAATVTRQIFRTKFDRTLTLNDGELHYGNFYADGQIIDDGICSAVRVGGTSAVDFCVHGGVRVLERLLALCERLGIQVNPDRHEAHGVWDAGDPTRREIIHAMQQAKTARGVALLARQWDVLPHVLAQLSARVRTDPSAARGELESLRRTGDAAHRLIHGSRVVLVGPPNSGKSTLFNALVGRHAVVVTDTPGTTRDWIREWIEIDGVPIELTDTPGVHHGGDELEAQAIDAGGRHIARADLRLILLDPTASPTQSGAEQIRNWKNIGPYVVVRSKSDLVDPGASEVDRKCPAEFVAVSGSARTGLGDLGHAITSALGVYDLDGTRPHLISARQVSMVVESLERLSQGGPSDAESVARLLEAATTVDDR